MILKHTFKYFWDSPYQSGSKILILFTINVKVKAK